MAIYRGPGGSGDATQDAASEVLLALQAKDAAIAAQVAAEAAQAAAELAETNAETAETNAETAETNAETAATNAANSASAASTSASNAASSASAASTSASNASTSASNAASSASAASTSASNAASSASSASTSASNASTSATNAANSATAAQAAQAAAEAALDQFDDTYLGAKASNPTVDNDGNALTTGDQYFNTVANELRIWNGSSWQAASTVGGTVTSLTVTGAFAANGGATLGDASGDALTINSSAVSIPNGLNFDSNTLVIDATNNQVGIGTNSPTAGYKLDIVAQLSSLRSGSTAYAYFDVINSYGTTRIGTDGSGVGTLGTASNLPLAIITNNTERMRIDSSGNVGIGTSSPVGRLAVNGISNFGTGFASTDISNTRPAYVRSSDNNSLISFQSSSTTGDGFMVGMAGAEPRLQVTNNLPLAFLTNNTERMRIISDGRVGIGTTAPTNRFVVSNAGAEGLETRLVHGDGSTVGGSLLSYNRGTAAFTPIEISGSIVKMSINDTERMRIDSSGNVGIGTSSPIDKLNVSGAVVSTSNTVLDASSSAAVFDYHSPSDGTRIIACDPSGSNIQFLTNPASGSLAERMRINSAGNVGIGTSSPTSLLDVGGNINGSNYYINVAAGTMGYADASASHVFYSSTGAIPNTQVFNTGGSERMRIDSSGNVGIGTSSPTSKLHLAAAGDVGGKAVNSATTGSATWNVTNNSGSLAQLMIYGSAQGAYGAIGSGEASVYSTVSTTLMADNGSGVIKFATGGNTERMRITAAGGLALGTTADPGAGAIFATGNITAYYSDDRLKTKLGSIENALDKVSKLNGFYYEANETAQELGYQPKREAGVSAQEVQAVLPEVVVPAPIDDKYLTVQYERLVPLLIEAIKELKAEIDVLKNS